MIATRQKIILPLVIVLIFSTVGGVHIAAAESTVISNSVHSSSNTGGRDGMSGQDGQDGVDGQDGISGDSTARAEVITTVDGETITEISTETTGSGVVSVTTTDDIDGGNPGESTPQLSTSSEKVVTEISDADRSRLATLVATLQTILQKYVDLLFK